MTIALSTIIIFYFIRYFTIVSLSAARVSAV
jgi:hypothetical protein